MPPSWMLAQIEAGITAKNRLLTILKGKLKGQVRSHVRSQPTAQASPALRPSRLRLVPTLNLLPLLPGSLLRRTLLFKADVSMADATPSKDYTLGKFLVHCTIILWLIFIVLNLREQRMPWGGTLGKGAETPLVMQGGDPYIRALMRTISASESNVQNPYAVIYGGEYTQDLSRHPDRCVPIAVGPNVGQCTTAAGRYQFITTTWLEQAERYHPHPGGFWLWHRYSFEPLYQDAVVYRWLSDATAWGTDLSSLLRQGKITQVLEILSPTWTSLGYGIETNSMSASLPQVYQRVLREELSLASMPATPTIQIGQIGTIQIGTPQMPTNADRSTSTVKATGR